MTGLAELPQEIIYEIFLCFDLQTLGRIQRVCSSFRETARPESFWKDVCYRKWPASREIPFLCNKVAILGWRYRCQLATGNVTFKKTAR